jgi:hypothetical protein
MVLQNLCVKSPIDCTAYEESGTSLLSPFPSNLMHIYTRELLDKDLLPELKEITLGLGITPAGNKTRRETWIAALAGQPFPLFQSIAPWSRSKNSSIPIAPAMPIESPGAKIPPVSIVERSLESRPASRPERVARSENSPGVVGAQEPIEKSPGAKTEQKMSQSAIAEAAENSLGVEVDRPRNAYRKIPRCRSPPSGDRIPRSGICTRSCKCATPGAKSETAGTCPSAI